MKFWPDRLLAVVLIVTVSALLFSVRTAEAKGVFQWTGLLLTIAIAVSVFLVCQACLVTQVLKLVSFSEALKIGGILLVFGSAISTFTNFVVCQAGFNSLIWTGCGGSGGGGGTVLVPAVQQACSFNINVALQDAYPAGGYRSTIQVSQVCDPKTFICRDVAVASCQDASFDQSAYPVTFYRSEISSGVDQTTLQNWYLNAKSNARSILSGDYSAFCDAGGKCSFTDLSAPADSYVLYYASINGSPTDYPDRMPGSCDPKTSQCSPDSCTAPDERFLTIGATGELNVGRKTHDGQFPYVSCSKKGGCTLFYGSNNSWSAVLGPYKLVSENCEMTSPEGAPVISGVDPALLPQVEFWADPPQLVEGAITSTDLNWTCSQCDTVTISQGIGGVDNVGGFVTVSPVQSTTYTLIAGNAYGTVIRQVTIEFFTSGLEEIIPR